MCVCVCVSRGLMRSSVTTLLIYDEIYYYVVEWQMNNYFCDMTR